MQFFILVLLICLFVFLYCVYVLTHDDFIFLRRDVTMEKIFNVIFLGSLWSLFFARLFYGLFTEKNILGNPFVFLLFPYFPGLSLLGGVLGVGAFFGFLARWENPLPLGRMSDLFSIAFLVTLPIGILGYFMFSEDGLSVIRAGSLIIAYLILFIVFIRFLLPQLLNGKFKEGTIALLFLISFSIISLVEKFIGNIGRGFTLTIEDFILIFVLIVSLTILIKNENLLTKFKKHREAKKP